MLLSKNNIISLLTFSGWKWIVKLSHCGKKTSVSFIRLVGNETRTDSQILLNHVNYSFPNYARAIFWIVGYSRTDLTVCRTLVFVLLPGLDRPSCMTVWTTALSSGSRPVYLNSDCAAPVWCQGGLCLFDNFSGIVIVIFLGDCLWSVLSPGSITLCIRSGIVIFYSMQKERMWGKGILLCWTTNTDRQRREHHSIKIRKLGPVSDMVTNQFVY